MALFEERDLARWGRAARAWLVQEDRRRTIGLVVLSVTISIAVSLIATASSGSSRGGAPRRPGDVLPPDVGEPLADMAPTAEAGRGHPGHGGPRRPSRRSSRPASSRPDIGA